MKDITQLVMQMQAMVHRTLMKGVDQTKVTTGQPKVLAFLKHHEGLSQKDIAKACQVEPGSLTVLLNRMETLGMVERRRAEGNRRSQFVYLTSYGHELASQVVDRFYEVEKIAFAGVSEEDAEVFERVCRQVVTNLEK